MRRTPITRATAGAAALLASLAALSACTEEPAPDQSAAETKVDLVGLLNESERLFKELYEIEPEITRACLENEGFAVHDEHALYQHHALGVDQGGLQEDYYAFEEWLPERDIAAEWGFGQWLWMGEEYSDELITEYSELRHPEEPDAEVEEDLPDNSAFEALDAEEQIAWYTAFMGEAKMVYEDRAWRLRHPDASEAEINRRESEIQAVADDGSIEGELEIIPPEPGGCELATIEALYGEPQLVEEPMEEGVEEGLTIYTWKFRPEVPPVPATDTAFVETETAEASEAFLSCVFDGGYGEWQFQEGGMLPIYQYFTLVYTGEEAEPIDAPGVDTPEAVLPELPADLPGDFEGKKAYEIDMAVAFDGCADEVGYREAVMASLDAAELAAYEAIETELFAYQEQLRNALKTAQDLLEA